MVKIKLYIKQKRFSLTKKFDVYDEYGKIKYQAKPDLSTLIRDINVTNINGELVITAKRIFPSTNPMYSLEIVGLGTYKIEKIFTLCEQNYTIPALNLKIHGDAFAHNYSFILNNTEIACVEKKGFTLRDIYILSVHNPTNELIALAALFAVDCIREDIRR